MKVAAFHSKLPGAKCHHNNDSCPDANNVALQNREAGTGGLPLCDRCAHLAPWRGLMRRRASN